MMPGSPLADNVLPVSRLTGSVAGTSVDPGALKIGCRVTKQGDNGHALPASVAGHLWFDPPNTVMIHRWPRPPAAVAEFRCSLFSPDLDCAGRTRSDQDRTERHPENP
jgi:hypothetical protein